MKSSTDWVVTFVFRSAIQFVQFAGRHPMGPRQQGPVGHRVSILGQLTMTVTGGSPSRIVSFTRKRLPSGVTSNVSCRRS
jgi:hypothetical protein